jgi:hypothetical protein
MSDLKQNIVMVNLSKVSLSQEQVKELGSKISDILSGKDTKGMELPPIADSTTVNVGVVSHTHDWK